MKTVTSATLLFIAAGGMPARGDDLEWRAFVLAGEVRLHQEPSRDSARVAWEPATIPLISGGNPSSPQTFDDDYGECWVHCKHGWVRADEIVMLRDAQERFHDMAQRAPSAFAHASLSRVFFELRQDKEAVAAAEDALKVDPRSTLALRARALIRLRQQQFDSAAADIERAIELDARAGEAYVIRGHVRSHLGHFKEAAADFGRAIALAPAPEADLYIARGDVWMTLKEFKKADSDFDRALKLVPWRHEVLQRSLAANDAKNFVEAQEMVRLDPSDAMAHMMLGHAYLSRVATRAARREYDESIRLDPASPYGFHSRARLSVALGRFAEAVPDFQKAIDVRPDDVSSRHQLAWLLATCPDPGVRDGARALRQATLACEMTDWQLYHVIIVVAAAHAECGQFDKALEYERKAVRVARETLGDGVAQSIEEEATPRVEAYKAHRPWRDGAEKTNLSPKSDETSQIYRSKYHATLAGAR